MSKVLWLCGYLVFLHVVHSYILLTANLDDFNAIARQIAGSPIAGQINRMIRRASNLFSQHIGMPRILKRANDGDEFEFVKKDVTNPQNVTLSDGNNQGDNQNKTIAVLVDNLETNEGSDNEDNKEKKIGSGRVNRENVVEQRNQGNDRLLTTDNDKNASFYLSSIKKIFEDV